MFCTACGIRNADMSNFCKQCGHKLDRTGASRISEEAFDRAIEKSAKITELTTESKTELDASKQRAQN